jgi:DNA-binding NarL/FixJ family response regulator
MRGDRASGGETAEDRDVSAAARRLLGADAPSPGAALRELADALARTLAAHGDPAALEDHHRHRAASQQARASADAILSGIARAEAAVNDLREITAPDTMLAAAPAALGSASRFDRIVLSHLRESEVERHLVWMRDSERTAAARSALATEPMHLARPLVEVELLRRRRPIIVTPPLPRAGVHRPLAAVLGEHGYVAAAITSRGRSIALLHAAHDGSTPVDHDADVLGTFANGLGQAHETASLRRLLRRERLELRRLLEWLDLRSAEIADALIAFEDHQDATSARIPVDDASPSPGAVDTLVFEGLLTRRELEVLRLLAEGRGNRAIADELVVAQGTVKYHVNRVLAKLHARNRAEAVARYHTLMASGRRR